MAIRDKESISIEMARVIPAEVQTAAKFTYDEEALQMPLLGPDDTDNERFTADNTMDDDDGKAAPPTGPVWLGPLSFLAFVLLFLSPWAFMAVLDLNKADILGFSFLAYLLLFAVLLAPVILAIVVAAGASSMKILKGSEETSEQGKLKDTAFAFVMFGVLWALLYLLFYGTIWVWASSTRVAPVLEMKDTISAFESKFEQAHALTELTTCLERLVPGGKVAISDVVLCLQRMGMTSPSNMELA